MNKLYVVGIGPGAADEMTLRAHKALEKAQVIVGYGAYIALVKPLFPEHRHLRWSRSAMQEENRIILFSWTGKCPGWTVWRPPGR